MKSPFKALLKELSRDVWNTPTEDEFNAQFESAFRQPASPNDVESIKFPLDPEPLLDLAKRISQDNDYAEAFRRDPVGALRRDYAPLASGAIDGEIRHASPCHVL